MLFRVFARQFSSASNQYSALNHSLLKHIYKYNYDDKGAGYIVHDPKTNQLISINPGNAEVAVQNINKLRSQLKAELQLIILTHHQRKYESTPEHIQKNLNNQVEIYVGDHEQKSKATQYIKELNPFTIGDLAICFIFTPGITYDSHSVAITHVNETSTQIPVMFSGQTVLVSSIGQVQSNDYGALINSLNKIRYFPLQTFVFPNLQANMKDLLFAKSLGIDNPYLESQIKLFYEDVKSPQKKSMLPTTLLQEKYCNPYFQINELGIFKNERDTIKNIQKLKAINEEYIKLSEPSLP